MGNIQNFHTVRGYEIIGKQGDSLSPGMEDYLEMIYRFVKTDGFVRMNTLAESLNVKAPSVTKMVQKLAGLGLVDYEKYSVIKLTDDGERTGRFLLMRHKVIENFLQIIGVKQKVLENVELIEHNVSNEALKKINALNNFFQSHPEVQTMFEEYRMWYETKATDYL